MTNCEIFVLNKEGAPPGYGDDQRLIIIMGYDAQIAQGVMHIESLLGSVPGLPSSRPQLPLILPSPLTMYPVGAQVSSVSHEPRPPLPDGFVLGEQVYFTGSTSRIFEDGDRLEHGKQGVVVGPFTHHKGTGKGVRVRFPGNKVATNCYLDQVCRKSRRSQPQLPVAQLPCSSPAHSQCTVWVHKVSHEPPLPLPGGYTAGEQVYFTGKSCTFESGDRLEHGKQGVVGPATGENLKGKGRDCAIFRQQGRE